MANAARKWWVSNPTTVVAAGHILVTMSTWVVALLAVTGVEDSVVVKTERGNTVKRISYSARLVARVEDLISGATRNVGPVPETCAPLLSTLAQRLPSPPGAPLIVMPPSASFSA